MQTELKRHLAIATGAVSAAAVPMGAEAAIIYKDASNAFSVSYTGTGSAEWDIDGAGVNDFRLQTETEQGLYIYLSSSGGRNGYGLVAPAVAGADGFKALPANFAVGPTLAGGYVWKGSGSRTQRSLMSSSIVANDFIGGAIGSNFIGFRFRSGTDMLYGWAEVILSTTDGGTVTINRWAYNDTPNGSIEVGQTSGGQPVPAPGTLALLAAAAFGLRRCRAQRAAA